MTQKEELQRLREENARLKAELAQSKPQAPESEQISDDTWRYDSIGLTVTAACKEDADQKAIDWLPIHEGHLKEREELEALPERTEEQEKRLEKLRKLR